jgi:hypothetical protein
MSLTCRLYDSIRDVNLPDWQRILSECGGATFMDPRLIAAAEAGMGESCRFRHAIVYDAAGVPVACANLSAMSIDLAYLVDPVAAWVLGHLPRPLSGLRHLKVLFCGLPISAGQNNLALAPHAPSRQVLAALDAVMTQWANQWGARAIVYKEFRKRDLEAMHALEGLGYRCIATPPMHLFPPRFPDFAHYRAALKSHYRKQIGHSQDKFQRGNIEIAILTDPADIRRVYTRDVHALYESVVDRSDMRLERLSLDFFLELSTRLQGNVELIVFSRQSRIVVIGWCLEANAVYHMLFMGIDYELNAEFDLYFNLIYAVLDRALRKGVGEIRVGQAADAFKAKLGCRPEPLYMYMKGLGPVLRSVVRYGSGFLVALPPAPPPFTVFRNDVVQASPDRSHPRT